MPAYVQSKAAGFAVAKKRSRRPPWPANPRPTPREQYRLFREQATASPTIDTGFMQDMPLSEGTATLPKVDDTILQPAMPPAKGRRPLGTVLMEYGTFSLAVVACFGVIGGLIWLIVGAHVNPIQTQLAVEGEKLRQVDERTKGLPERLRDEVRRLETLIDMKVLELADRLKKEKR